MKITRIEGKNLACFRDFELDLDQGPLQGANLYAIIGKTGSGKSTLLDAVCLALFDTLPRVDGKGVDLGQGYHTGKSVSAVRRGATEASARCEFIGIDGVRYRSEWSVRSSGRGPLKDLKVEEPRLLELDAAGNVVLTIKGVTEHRARVQKVVGLSAEEFRRSALLAQNEFAAFLQAPAKDRAVILEALTGSELYTEIGKQVFRLATGAESGADDTGRRLRTWTGWTVEKEAVVQAAREAAELELAGSEEVAEALTSEARVLAEQAERQRRLALAEQQVAEAEAASVARAPDRERLSLADEAEAARGPWETHRKAIGELSSANAQQVRRAADQERCSRQQGAAAAEEQRTRVLDLAATRALADGLPVVAAARVADQVLADAVREHVAAAKNVALTDAAVRKQWASLTKAEALRDRVQGEQAALQGWLGARAEVGATLGRGDPLPALDFVVEANARLLLRMKALSAAELAHSQGRTKLAEALTGVERAERATAEALALVQALPPRPALPGLLAIRALAVAVQGRSARAWACHHEVADRTGLLAQSMTSHADAASKLPVLEAALLAAREAAGEAEQDARLERKLVSRLRAMHGLAELRLGLTVGEPCVLCGSTEHPFAVPGAVSPLHDAEETERKAVLEASRTQLAAGKAEAVLEGERAGCVRLSRDVAVAEATLGAARSALEDAEAGRLADGPLRPQLEIDAEVETADAAVRGATQLIEEFDLAEAALQRRRAAEAQARRIVEPLQLAEGVAGTQLASARNELEADQGDADEKRRLARLALGAWPGLPDIATDAGSARQLVADTKAEFEAQSQALQSGSARLVVVEVAMEQEVVKTSSAEAAHEAAVALQLRATTLEGEEREARAAILGGQPADTVESRLRASLQAAASAAKAAAEAARTLDEALRLANVELLAATGTAASAEAAAGHADRELEVALEARGWTRETLAARLLDHGPRESLRSSLEVTLGLVRTALARRDEAKAHLEALSVPPDADPVTLPARQADALARLSSARTALSDALLAYRESDRSKLDHADLTAEHARLTELAAPWKQLRELIGDAQGARFRALAQARVMDSLVELANEKLAIFAKRYTLCRVGEGARDALDLQVLDTEGEGGVRGTRSLSGGETFLVSLALALALGRLVSRTSHLRTLFIDEGFGSLDSESILPVLAALATVATGDVQIGLISHVPEIAEGVSARVEVKKQGGVSRLLVTA